MLRTADTAGGRIQRGPVHVRSYSYLHIPSYNSNIKCALPPMLHSSTQKVELFQQQAQQTQRVSLPSACSVLLQCNQGKPCQVTGNRWEKKRRPTRLQIRSSSSKPGSAIHFPVSSARLFTLPAVSRHGSGRGGYPECTRQRRRRRRPECARGESGRHPARG